MTSTIDNIWIEFVRFYGNATPVRNKEQLKAVLHAAGIRYEDVIANKLLENIRPEWIDGTDSRPFLSDKWNDEYEHLCALRGIDTSEADEDEFDPLDGEFNDELDDDS